MKKILILITAIFMFCSQSAWAAFCTCSLADNGSPLTLTFNVKEPMCKQMPAQLAQNMLVINSDNCELKGKYSCQLLVKPRHYVCKFSIT